MSTRRRIDPRTRLKADSLGRQFSFVLTETALTSRLVLIMIRALKVITLSRQWLEF